MKQGKKPTVSQRKHLESLGLEGESWLICKNTPQKMVVEHRRTLELKEVEGMKV